MANRHLTRKRLPIRTYFASRVAAEVCLSGAIGVHHVNFWSAVTVGFEHDLGPIGRPGGICVKCRIVGAVGLAGAVGVHRVDLKVAIAVANERDLRAVGRPVGRGFSRWVVRDVCL